MVDRLIDGAGLAFRYVVNDVGYGDRMAKDITTGKTSIIAGMSAMVHGVIDNLKFAYKKVLDKQIIFRMQYQMRNGRFWDPNFGFVDRCINTGTNDGKLDYAQTLASQDFLAKAGPFGQTVDYCAQTGGPCGGFFSIRILRNNIVDLQTVHIPLTKDDFGKLLQLWQDKRGLSPVQVMDGSVLGQQLQIDDQDKAIGLKDVYDGLQAVLPEDRKQELADYFPKFETEMSLVKPGQFNPGVIWPRIDLGVMSGGVGIGMGDVHLGSVHEEIGDSIVAEGVSVTEVPKYEAPVVFSEPHPRGGVEVVAEKIVAPMVTRMIPVNGVIEDTVSHLRGVIKAEVSESTEEVMAPQVTLPDVHLGSVHEEVSVTEVPVYALPVVVVPVASDFRREERITEITPLQLAQTTRLLAGSAGGQVSRAERFGGQAKILVSAAPEGEITVSQVDEAEKIVGSMVTRMIPVNGVIEDTVSHLRGVIKAEVSESTEEVMAPQVTLPDVHLGSVHESEEEVITESTRLQAPGALATGGQAELAEGTEELESRKRKFGVFNYDSMVSVIKETFDNKLAERKSVKSVKEKIAWLQRQVANVVADQLMGRNTDEPVLGWLVHGWAMMQFDGIEEKQKMKRFSLSPVRIWADRVTGVARRVKDKFVRTGFSVYKQLFAAI